MLEGGEVIISCEVGNRVGAVQWVKDGFAYVIQPSEYNKLEYSHDYPFFKLSSEEATDSFHRKKVFFK